MFFYTFMPRLFNMSLTASVAIVLVILLRLLLKKAPKVISYALWGIVLFRLLCPVSVGSSFSLYNLFDASTEEAGMMTSVIEYVPGDIVHAEYPAVVLPVPGISDVINEALPQGQEQLAADPLEAPMSFATYVWMTGVLVMVIYSIVSYIQLRHKLSVVVPLRDNIFIADDIKSPFVVGLFRPKIYLPCNLREKEQEYIILHEQHHIKRLDHIVKALAFLALAIHWFNPLVWVAFILASKDMEMSCDEAVIRKVGSDVRADYSASLLTLATGRRIIAGTPLAFGEGDTKGRIHNLSKWKKPAVWVIIVAVIVCISTAISLLTNPLRQGDFLRLTEQDTPSGKNQVLYEIELGDKVKSGTIYTEEWSNGICVRSTPVALTQSVEEIGILTSERRENNSVVGIDIQIDAGENGGSLVTYFAFPENNSIRGWAFTAYELNEKVEIVPDDEVILAAMAFDAGGGVRTFSPGVLISEPERLENADYMIVIRAHFSAEQTDNQNTEPVLWNGELIPGTTYVPYQCLYMNPLSSFAAVGGDSGCKYIVGEDYFATVSRNDGSFVSVTHLNLDTATSGLDGLQNLIDVSKWEWQEFPYTDEEWAALYVPPQGFGGISNISELYDEMLYQPLAPDKFLLKMDSSLWLVELSSNEQMGTYLWSIYSLVPESAMGVAQWEYAPMLSSRCPYFRFVFNIDYTEISAACTQSPLVDFDAPGTPSDAGLTFQKGNALYWSPIDEDGNVVTAAIIHFTVQQGETMPYAGTIYIEGNSGSDGRRIYNAAIVGTGLHIDSNTEIEGGVITAAADSNVVRVVKHDLTTGDLEVPVEQLVNYVFYINSEQISVTVNGSDFEGQVNLLDVSQDNAHILQHKVNPQDDNCLFTGLTSARLYRVNCEGLEACTVVISGEK